LISVGFDYGPFMAIPHTRYGIPQRFIATLLSFLDCLFPFVRRWPNISHFIYPTEALRHALCMPYTVSTCLLILAHSACSSDHTKIITRKLECKVLPVEIRVHAHALVLGGISRGAEGPPLGLRDPSRPSPKPEPLDC